MSELNPLIAQIRNLVKELPVSLPTLGKFYPPGVLAESADPENIRVSSLNVIDEHRYKNPFLLITGKAIKDLIKHISPEILEPEECCAIDIETILIASRIVSYGSTLNLVHNCQEIHEEKICNTDNNLSIDLYEFIQRYETITDDSEFELFLPRVEQTVYLKPIPYKTNIEILKSVTMNRKKMDELMSKQDEFILQPEEFIKFEHLVALGSDMSVKATLDCIYGVKPSNGDIVEDPEILKTWVYELPIGDYEKITKRIDEINLRFREISSISYECKECKKENKFYLNMDATILFTPGLEQTSTVSPISSEPQKKKSRHSRHSSRVLSKSQPVSTI